MSFKLRLCLFPLLLGSNNSVHCLPVETVRNFPLIVSFKGKYFARSFTSLCLATRYTERPCLFFTLPLNQWIVCAQDTKHSNHHSISIRVEMTNTRHTFNRKTKTHLIAERYVRLFLALKVDAIYTVFFACFARYLLDYFFRVLFSFARIPQMLLSSGCGCVCALSHCYAISSLLLTLSNGMSFIHSTMFPFCGSYHVILL